MLRTKYIPEVGYWRVLVFGLLAGMLVFCEWTGTHAVLATENVHTVLTKTQFHVALNEDLNPSSTSPDNPKTFVAHTLQPLYSGETEALPAGAIVRGLYWDGSTKFKKHSVLMMFRSVDLPGGGTEELYAIVKVLPKGKTSKGLYDATPKPVKERIKFGHMPPAVVRVPAFRDYTVIAAKRGKWPPLIAGDVLEIESLKNGCALITNKSWH